MPEHFHLFFLAAVVGLFMLQGEGNGQTDKGGREHYYCVSCVRHSQKHKTTLKPTA
jgi:hypothetical protein